MKIKPTIQTTQSSVAALGKVIREAYEKLAFAFNGHVSFGSFAAIGSGNIEGAWVSITTPAAYSDIVISHQLGRPSAGYLVVQKDRPCDVYTSPTVAADANNQIVLRADASGAELVIFII